MSISSNSLDPVASNTSIISIKQQSVHTPRMCCGFVDFVVYCQDT